MSNRKGSQAVLKDFALRGVAAAVMLACAGGAAAFEIELQNPDVKMRWDNTVRYTLGSRVESQDQRLLRNPVYDEGDKKFGKGDIVTNRLDLLTEFDVSYKGKIGARVSGAAWYDNAYDDHSVTAPTGTATAYTNNTYNSTVQRYVNGPSGEILDAFVWTNFALGNTPVNVKVGRQTNVWGEGLLIGAHAVSYGQSPVDGVKAVTNPGIETKEVFLPIGQIHVSTQVTDSLTLVGQYFYDWVPTRVPHAGTYLMGADTAPTSDYLSFPIPGNFKATIIDPKKPKDKNGNWGVGARMNVEAIESNFGAYYRVFDDYTPELGVQLSNFAGPLPRNARFLYPEDIKMWGLTFSRVIGGVSVGAEVSHRKNGALNTPASHTLDTGARGDTWHAVLNGIYMLPQTKFWDTGSLTTEIAYNRLDKVTTNPQLYRGVGAPTCVNSATGRAGNERDGCSTKDAWFLAVKFSPQYLNIFPSWDLTLPVSVNYGLSGNAATAGGGTEREVRWSVGATMTYASKYEFALNYSDRYLPVRTAIVAGQERITGGAAQSNSSVGVIDRGWVSLTFKAAF